MILQRYVLREILQAFAAVLAVLLLVYMSNRFVGYLAEAASGKISSDLLLEVLGLKVISNLPLLITLAFYVAILLGLGRLYRDSEIVAMTASGVGPPHLARTVFWLSLTFAGLSAALSLYLSPYAAALQEALYDEAKQRSEITGIVPGRFKEFGDGDQVVYVEAVDPEAGRMRNVFVQVRREQSLDILVSRSAYQTRQGPASGRYIVLSDGRRYRGEPGSVDYVVTRFDRHGVLVEPRGGNDARKVDTVPTVELVGSDRGLHVAELQWRISQPISVLLLGMLAVPLARTSTRQGRYAKLFTAVLVYFIYNNLIGITQNLVERGELHPWIGVWPVHLALALLVAVTLFAHSSGRWRLAAAMKRARRTK